MYFRTKTNTITYNELLDFPSPGVAGGPALTGVGKHLMLFV